MARRDCRPLSRVFRVLLPVVLAHALFGQIPGGMLLNDPKTGKLGPVREFGEPVLLEYADYPKILASEQLCPDRVVWKGKVMALGQSEVAFVRKLGGDYRIIDSVAERDPAGVKAFCLSILKEKPNTIHFYNLVELRERVERGWFKTYSWNLGKAGTLVVTFVATTRNGQYVSQFLRLRLVPSTSTRRTVKWTSGSTLARRDTVHATWGIDHNRIVLEDE